MEWVSLPQTPSVGLASVSESEHDCRMIAIALLFVRLLCDCFKSRRRLEAEILVLRHQLNVLHRRPTQFPTGSTAKKRNEVPPFHSISSSALASSVGGTSMPSVLAVCELMTNSNLIARRTGRSAGFSPSRTRLVLDAGLAV